MNPRVDVVVVGAGPVGLFLGCCLRRAGLSFVILEKRTEPSRHSRAIGLHPPALELAARLGLAEQLLARGIRIRSGAAYCGGRRLGELDFTRGPGPYGFILALPQPDTEQVLRAALPPQAVLRGVEVVGGSGGAGGVRVIARGAGGALEWRARFMAGCDGAASAVRACMGGAFAGAYYPDALAMGDFADATGWAAQARIFVDAQGFIESFPLPDGLRRWVVGGRAPARPPDARAFAAAIARRCGVELGGAVGPLSSFGVAHYLAAPFARGRLALAGDAAHVMSPTGGQGMNVGWCDAWDLAQTLAQGRDEPDALERIYAGPARRRARVAIRRAGQNLAIGRGLGVPALRTALVYGALHLPLQRWLVRRFTLCGLLQV